MYSNEVFTTALAVVLALTFSVISGLVIRAMLARELQPE
jgi:hypothetical protein